MNLGIAAAIVLFSLCHTWSSSWAFLSNHNNKINRIFEAKNQLATGKASVISSSNTHTQPRRREYTKVYNSAKPATTKNSKILLNDSQIDFTMGYMNKHHGNVLIKFVEIFTQIGAEQLKKNAFSGGSYEILNAKLISIDYTESNIASGTGVGILTLEVNVQIRGKKEPTTEVVNVSLGKY